MAYQNPFLRGWQGAADAETQQRQSQLQQAQTLAGLHEMAIKRQDDEALKAVLAESGGDVEKALAGALRTGNVAAAQKLVPLAKMQEERRNAEDTAAGMRRIYGAPQTAQPEQPQQLGEGQPIAIAGDAPQRLNPSMNPREIRIQQLRDEAALPANLRNPVVLQRIENQIDRLLKMNEPIPPRNRISGDVTIQEEFDHDTRTWKEIGRGPRFAPRVNAAGGGPKAPIGFRYKDDGVTLEPVPGGPKDNTLNLTGGRESVYVQRMMMGANQAAKDLANVVQLPLTASTGILGGRKQGPGLLDAGMEVLANKATGQEAQAYNAMATGFQRSLAQIESAGLMPSGSLTHQMDAVLFKEGDTNLTKMHKLAQTRQIVEAGMEVIESNPRVSPSEKAKVKDVLGSIRKSVPFTHSDLIRLQALHQTNPKATLKDVIGKDTDEWKVVK